MTYLRYRYDRRASTEARLHRNVRGKGTFPPVRGARAPPCGLPHPCPAAPHPRTPALATPTPCAIPLPWAPLLHTPTPTTTTRHTPPPNQRRVLRHPRPHHVSYPKPPRVLRPHLVSYPTTRPTPPPIPPRLLTPSHLHKGCPHGVVTSSKSRSVHHSSRASHFAEAPSSGN